MKPILFNAEMVQAILAGRRTVIRRPVGEDKRGEWFAVNDCRNHEYGASVPCYLHREIAVDDTSCNIMYLKYDVGDVLWVRETWARISDWAEVAPEVGLFDGYIYRADWGGVEQPRWRPSIHMPKEAARLFLLVTAVRAERLQDITEEQAVAEGFTPLIDRQTGAVLISAKECFHIGWDFIYAAKGYGWEENPWVWVIEFEKTGCA